MRIVFILMILLAVLSQSAYADETSMEIALVNGVSAKRAYNVKRLKPWQINSVVLVPIAAYGALNWWNEPYGFKLVDDGMFSANDKTGGADKLGHVYATYAIARGLNYLYRANGYGDEAWGIQGPLTSWSIMLAVEVMDSIQSKFYFSYTDVIANTFGAALAHIENRNPAMDDLLDFRVEYLPSEGFLDNGKMDFATDYSGMGFLVALKMSGISVARDTPFSWIEFHCGYYTRGYQDYDAKRNDKHRAVYLGTSLNLSRILNHSFKHKDAFHALDYYQPPYTSIRTVQKLD